MHEQSYISPKPYSSSVELAYAAFDSMRDATISQGGTYQRRTNHRSDELIFQNGPSPIRPGATPGNEAMAKARFCDVLNEWLL